MQSTYISRLRVAALASVALSGVAAPGPMSASAQAQALNPLVDVCTGVSVNQSTVSNLLKAVNQPIVAPIQTTFNDLLGLTVNIPPLTVLAPLDIDVSGIVDNAVAGNPIGVQVLDTDGNVVSPGNCNVTTDGYSLNTDAGISIGGNAITGLGASGDPASAGEINSIAFGNGATTDPTATMSAAIGYHASATAPNSVALGANSVADRGALTGYAAPGLTGTYNSVGSLSVGAPGAERQITNVAPGTLATDAATVGQVTGAVAAATADSVRYDDPTHASVTFDGAGGTTLTNVAPGTLSAGSTDAVNGSQLYATNQQVAANTSGVATNTADIAALQAGAVQYDDASHATVTLDGVGGTTISNVAAGDLSATSTEAVNGSQLYATNQQVSQNTSDISALQGDVSGLQADLGTLGSSAVQYDDASHATVTFDGAAGTTLSNVADGSVAADSTDAVNGSQLYATNQTVAANTTSITNLDGRVTTNESDISTLQDDFADVDARVTTNGNNIAVLQQQVANVPVQFVSDTDRTTPSATPTDTVAMISASGGPATLTNVAPGTLSATSTDAVNGSQLYATNQQVGQNTADIQTINNNLAGSTVVAVQYSNPDAPTVSNGGTITNDVALIGANGAAPVGLHNVAAGTLANDAVNVGQLQSGLASAMADAHSYTDSRFDELRFDLSTDVRQVRRNAFSGTAAAMAVAGIPQTMEPGQSMVGGGIGYYRGQTAFALGASTTFNDGRGVVKAGATLDTHGKGGFSAGAGFGF